MQKMAAWIIMAQEATKEHSGALGPALEETLSSKRMNGRNE
jgi:hypothetical protein